jgi:hypothetical protein
MQLHIPLFFMYSNIYMYVLGKTDSQTIRDVWNIQNLDMVMKYANGLGPDINFFTGMYIFIHVYS